MVKIILEFFTRYHERKTQQNASRLEQAVRREFWFSNALDRLRQPKERSTNDENFSEITPSPMPKPTAPGSATPPPRLPAKPKSKPVPIPTLD